MVLLCDQDPIGALLREAMRVAADPEAIWPQGGGVGEHTEKACWVRGPPHPLEWRGGSRH